MDDPIPFMQLLAKSDSGITEVIIIKLHFERLFPSCGFLLVLSLSIVMGFYEGPCSRIHFVVLLIYRISSR